MAAELHPTDVTVEFDIEGTPQDAYVHFRESSGMAFFDISGDTAQYSGHVHSIDRKAARKAVANICFIESVDMDYQRPGE